MTIHGFLHTIGATLQGHFGDVGDEFVHILRFGCPAGAETDDLPAVRGGTPVFGQIARISEIGVLCLCEDGELLIGHRLPEKGDAACGKCLPDAERRGDGTAADVKIQPV